jgi:hypothetical protein
MESKKARCSIETFDTIVERAMANYYLKLDLENFQQAVRAVLTGRFPILTMQMQVEGDRRTFVPRGDWQVHDRMLTPQNESIFACLLVLSDSRPAEIADLILPGQTIINLVVSRERIDSVQALVYCGKTLCRLDKITLVGPGMISMGPTRTETQEPHTDSSRASRIVGFQGASRGVWKEGTILVVGSGSGGSCLAIQLAALDPAGLVLVDPDIVKAHNLANMPHASIADVRAKRRKVHLLGKHLHRNTPDLVVQSIPGRIQDPKVVAYLKRRDLLAVFSFVDDLAGHLQSSRLANYLLVPHIAVGTLIQSANRNRLTQQVDVRLFEPFRGCVRCVPNLPDAQLQEALYEMQRPAGAMRRGVRRHWTDGGRVASSLALNQIAAGLAVDLFARYLRCEITTSTWIRYISQGAAPQLVEESVGADTRCSSCTSR